jgi:hypothetical protein
LLNALPENFEILALLQKLVDDDLGFANFLVLLLYLLFDFLDLFNGRLFLSLISRRINILNPFDWCVLRIIYRSLQLGYLPISLLLLNRLFPINRDRVFVVFDLLRTVDVKIFSLGSQKLPHLPLVQLLLLRSLACN